MLWESPLERFFLKGFLSLAFRGFQLNNSLINKFPSIHVKGHVPNVKIASPTYESTMKIMQVRIPHYYVPSLLIAYFL